MIEFLFDQIAPYKTMVVVLVYYYLSQSSFRYIVEKLDQKVLH